MLKHLATGMPAPGEYTELQLCREFHCLPSQLRAERFSDIYRFLIMMSAEEQVRQTRQKRK